MIPIVTVSVLIDILKNMEDEGKGEWEVVKYEDGDIYNFTIDDDMYEKMVVLN